MMIKRFFYLPLLISLSSLFPSFANDADAELSGMIRDVDGAPRFFIDRTVELPVFTTHDNTKDLTQYVVTLSLGDEIWKGKDDYKFDEMDEKITEITGASPNSPLLVKLFITSPKTWRDAHPDDLFRDQTQQPVSRTPAKSVPELQDTSFAYSLFSQTFLDDARIAVEKTISHMRTQKYFRRIIGFVVDSGQNDAYDYSPAAHNSFKAFLKTKYENAEALRKASNNKNASFATIAMPVFPSEPVLGIMNPQKDRLVADFSVFSDQKTIFFLEEIAQTIKKHARKPVLLGVDCENVFSDMSKSLTASETIDLITSPTSSPFTVFSCQTTLKRHRKLQFWAPDDNFYKNGLISPLQNSFFLFGDLIVNGNGAFLDTLSGWPQARRIYLDSLYDKTRFRPDMAVVINSRSSHWLISSERKRRNDALINILRSISLSGVPFDIFFLDDLLDYPALSEYKVYVLPNSLFLTDAQRDFIGKRLKRQGKTVIWSFLPGFVGDYDACEINTFNTCGFNVEIERKASEFEILPEKDNHFARNLPESLGAWTGNRITIKRGGHLMAPLAKYKNEGKIAAATKNYPDWTSALITTPGLCPPRFIHNLAKFAGAYVCCAPGVVVKTNGTFFAISAMEDGEYELAFPKPCSQVQNAMTGKIVAKQKENQPIQSVKVKLSAQKTIWLNVR